MKMFTSAKLPIPKAGVWGGHDPVPAGSYPTDSYHGEVRVKKFKQMIQGGIDQNGVCFNGSICGNDTASEQAMVRKYTVDSVKYWADKHHLDRFRFNLLDLIAFRKTHPALRRSLRSSPSEVSTSLRDPTVQRFPPADLRGHGSDHRDRCRF